MADETASDRPQPVLYSQLVTVVTALLGLVTAFGLRLNADQQKAILAAVSTMVPLIALAAAWWARRKVTPLADPRDNAGNKLVPETTTSGPWHEPPVITPPGGPPLPPLPPFPPPPPGGAIPAAAEQARRERDARGRWI
jgi:hypothetical protein